MIIQILYVSNKVNSKVKNTFKKIFKIYFIKKDKCVCIKDKCVCIMVLDYVVYLRYTLNIFIN